MQYYESIFILNPDLPSDQTEKIQQTMTAVVEKSGGAVHIIENWGVKRLAYHVKKFKKGNYMFMQFAGDGPALQELERNYRLNDGVIKYMSLSIEKAGLKPVETPAKPASEEESGE
ncbi:MAG: 30S ribosomal protein S6 [bacterium]|nr:30S ribosomal protein S6 [bacterium]